jgi:multisubunit Na+/H+ antiporter MnhF subunit
MSAVATGCLAVLAASALICVARMARGPSLADRVVALDTMVIVIVCAVVVGSVRADTGRFVAVVLVGALLGFCSTVTVARYIERRGARPTGTNKARRR